MEYINNIKSGFSVKIDDNGDFSGILRSGMYHEKDRSFSGNINTMTDHEKLKLEAILESAYPRMKNDFCQVYRKLLPGFEGFIIIVPDKE